MTPSRRGTHQSPLNNPSFCASRGRRRREKKTAQAGIWNRLLAACGMCQIGRKGGDTGRTWWGRMAIRQYACRMGGGGEGVRAGEMCRAGFVGCWPSGGRGARGPWWGRGRPPPPNGRDTRPRDQQRRCNLLRCFCGARGRRTLEPALRRTRRVKAARVHATRFSNFRRVATLRARRILRLLLRLPRLLRLQIGKTAR